MSLLTGIFTEAIEAERQRSAEARSSLENPQTPLSYPAEWLLDIFNGGRTDSGIRVSELTAFQVVTFLACVDLIAGSIASLPLHVYERSFLATGRAVHKVAYDHDLYDLMHAEPNDEMSSFTLRKAMMVHALAWGNGYVEIQRDGGNGVVALWPRNPAKTRPFRLSRQTRLDPVPWRPFPLTLPAETLCYKTTDGMDDQDRSENDASSSRSERIIPKEDMIHIPGLSFDGRIGQSMVWLARQTLGLALATEKYGAKYFANYARPGGILEVSYTAGSPQYEKAKQSWQEAQGGENSGRVAVLPPGMKWTPTGNNPEEAQTTVTQEFIRNQICSFFHVPPHKVGDVDKGRANTEQLAQEFVTDTLGSWLSSTKQEYKRKLFPHSGIGRTPKNRFYADYDLHDLIRPDAASREKFYATGRQYGFLNTNDIREFEKLNPIDEDFAEDYWMPVNMTLAETPLDPNSQDGAGNGKKTSDVSKQGDGADQQDANKGKKKPNGSGSSTDEEDSRLLKAYSRLFAASFGRIQGRNNANLRDFQQAFVPIFSSLADLFAIEGKGEISQDTERFISEYLISMRKRSAEWSKSDKACDEELSRAIRAIRIAVYRDLATQQALEVSSELPTGAVV